MKLLNLVQGTDEWLQARANYFTASDAPAMMGDSKYKSRNQLLQEKKTGRRETVDAFKQNLFDKGHAAEAAARNIIEINMLETFAPVVGVIEVDGVSLLASLDGLSENGSTVFEHKLFNATLAENVKNKVLEPSHYWQLEQQLLVAGAQNVLFVCSDGTEESWAEMFYTSDPERRAALIAGWKQFAKDFETFEPEVKVESVVANKAEDFPLVNYRVEGSTVISNIAQVMPVIAARAEEEMNRVLETDQDFADKEALNKATKAARDRLKDIVEQAKGEFVSFSEFASTAAQVDSVLQKMQSHGEKQVKEAKERKKNEIREAGDKAINNYLAECEEKISPLSVRRAVSVNPDFVSAMKGKRNLESLKDAVDDVVAAAKIEIDKAMSRIVPNQVFVREHDEYSFLFPDIQQIINQDLEPFQAIVKSRIAAHVEAEEKKAEDLREQIRKEEEAKANEKTEQAAEKVADKVVEKIEKPKQDEKPEQSRTVSVGNNSSYEEELAAWAKKHFVSGMALKELNDILSRHMRTAA